MRAIVFCLIAALAGPAGAQWISFPASRAEIFGNTGERAEGHASYPVRAYLSLPVETGRHPAIVLLPSCEGRKLFHQSWAQALSERGYVALVVDDYFMYDRDQTCGISNPDARADLLELRLLHALGATRYLLKREEVDGSRIAVMGWGDAPIGTLISRGEDVDAKQVLFRAGVSVTPARCDEFSPTPPRPLLILRAGSNPDTPDDKCPSPLAASDLELKVYQGTRPGFDNPETRAAEGSGTAGESYDRLAFARAIEDVVAFLDRRLPKPDSDTAHQYGSAQTATSPDTGTWATDPGQPGPDLPPTGGSAFDAVFSRATGSGAVYDVPFPFENLLARLRHAAGAENMPGSPLDATLIPLGRSLQREAAAPDYFHSPRIVVAVTGEPDTGSGPLGVRLKNRLFLGFQPRAEILEVVSYNEAAGRFEFQVVTGYGADREADVRYARRALCVSCHQNAGPIFSEASWDETTANARVVQSLGDLGKAFHGIPVTENDRAVSSIDAATDEANLLPVYQLLWAEGCDSFLPVEMARCRAGALQAMVQYRLSSSAGFDRSAPLYRDGYLASQRDNWRERWPDGLLIPNPNLPDRSPLMSASPSTVPVALDPLRQRDPLARWNASSERDLERLVRGLSRELPARDIQRLDQHLRQAGGTAPSRRLTAECEVVRRGVAGRPRLLTIECRGERDGNGGFDLGAQIQVHPDGRADGEAGWLELGGAIYARRTLTGRVDGTSGRRIALEVLGYGDSSIRAPDGGAVRGLSLEWDAGIPDHQARFPAHGTLAIADDFRPVAAAIRRLAATASASSPLLSDRFDGVRLGAWLLSELGTRPVQPCCGSRPLPVPRLDTASPSTGTALDFELRHRGPMQTLERYCAACHAGNTAFPPGFLHGNADSVLGSVAQCADRIYFRLSMWQRREEDQVVPPMPPVQGLSLADTSVERWRQGESLERLIAYARQLIAEQGHDPDAVLANSYQATRPCLVDPAMRGYAKAKP